MTIACRRVLLAGLLGALVSALAAGPASAARNDTELVSRASLPLDPPASGFVAASAMSADGRYVAFESSADNLPGANGHAQVYVRDTHTGTTILVSAVNGTTTPGLDDSFAPSISADGRYVAFASDADNLPNGEPQPLASQVYVRDIKTNATFRVSAADGSATAANDHSWRPAISADGRHVAFTSRGSNLPGGSSGFQVYVRDTHTSRTRLVSARDGDTTPGGGTSESPSISADGRHIAFQSMTNDLPGGGGAKYQVYVRDTQTNRTRLVSAPHGDTTPGDDHSGGPSISADGRLVAFTSSSGNLPAGAPGRNQVYVRDTQTNATTLVSAVHGGAIPANGNSAMGSMSANGRYVAFESFAGNLPGGGAAGQVYVRDLQTNATVLVSAEDGNDSAGNDRSQQPSISADGRYVAFRSQATNLPDANGIRQAYRRDVLGAPPRNVAPPDIDGTAVVGGTLKCSTGRWSKIDPPTTFAFRWRRGSTHIPGATSATYVVQAADVARSLRCVVTATNPGGSASAASAAVVPPKTVEQPTGPDDSAGGQGPAGGSGPSGAPGTQGSAGPSGAPVTQGGTGVPGPADSPAPPGAGGSQAPPGPQAQRSGLRLNVIAAPARVRLRRPVRIRFAVSARATVRLDVRRAGKRKVIASRTVRVRAGRRSLVWNGRVRGRPARPGRYTLTLRATTRQGSVATAVTVQVLKRRAASRRGRR
jgi:Tol biopolymer transport system component